MAADLALGIVEGEERGRALEHLAKCPDCRAEVEKFSEVADELLLLAPHREPPVGFESRVLERAAPGAQAQAAAPAAARARPGGGSGRRSRHRPRHRRTRPSPRLALPAHARPGERQGVRVLRAARRRGHPRRDRLQLRGIAVLGAHRRGPGASLRADDRRVGHRRRQPGAAALVPPRSGGRLGWLDSRSIRTTSPSCACPARRAPSPWSPSSTTRGGVAWVAARHASTRIVSDRLTGQSTSRARR